MACSPLEMSFRSAKTTAQPKPTNLNRCQPEKNMKTYHKKAFFPLQESPLLGAWSDCSREFSVEEGVKHHELGWHMMMQFSPALFGCYIWHGNHSFEIIRRRME